MRHLHVSAVKYFCLICINRQYPQNCIEFYNDAWALLNFYSKYSQRQCHIQCSFEDTDDLSMEL